MLTCGFRRDPISAYPYYSVQIENLAMKPVKADHQDQSLEAFDKITSLPDHRSVWKIARRLLVIGLFLFVLAFNLSRAVRTDYNHDEDQFITSVRLLLDDGLLPYRDYPYFHTPYLVFIYAPLFALTGNFNLLAGRFFSAICATASVMLVFGMVLGFFPSRATRYRYLAAIGIAFLYLSSPLLAAAASYCWNHAFPVLCLLGSLGLILLAVKKKTPGMGCFLSGVLLGIAVGARASSLTILPAFLLALFWLPGEFSWRRIRHFGLFFMAGFGVALLPLLWLFATAPQQFIFGNLGYPRLNSIYRLDVPVAYNGNIPVYGARSLIDKLGFVWTDVISQPPNLLIFTLLAFFGWGVLATHLRRNDDQSFRNIFVFFAIPLIGVGSISPTPTWYQYFYAPFPFALLAISLGLAYLTQPADRARKWFMLLLLLLTCMANLFSLQDFRRISFLRYVDLWKPLIVHQVGQDLRHLVGANGRVFTIAPLYALEGGLRVYAPMATGSFAFRTGSLLSEEQRQLQGIISKENLAAYLDGDMPDGILVGFEPFIEAPLIQFATLKGYNPQPLDNQLTLWVRSDISPP